MKKRWVSLKIYGLTAIFLLYAVLQINQGISALLKTNAATRTTDKVNKINTVASPALQYKTEFPSIINYTFIR